MNIEVQNEKLVVAVSGGVDSVVLLDVLAKAGADVVVAHFDHGMRPDSTDDARFVMELAERYGVPFVGATAATKLTSEADAREARYKFLRQVQHDFNARRLVTAHHQDDLVETAILNLLRGTGRRGLSSLKSDDATWRPLLHETKAELIGHAKANGLIWHEDSTNLDTRLRRNYVRRVLLPQLESKDPDFRTKLLNSIQSAHEQNDQLNDLIEELALGLKNPEGLKRHGFIMLPHSLSREIMLHQIRESGAQDIDRSSVERLVIAAKTARPGTEHDICHHLVLKVTKGGLSINRRQPGTRQLQVPAV